MKKLVCLLCVLIILTLPTLGICETQSALKTALVEIDIPVEELCGSDEMRSYLLVDFLLSLNLKENISGISFNYKTTFIGYNGNTIYAVSDFQNKRVVFEFDTEYDFCLYSLEDNADMSQNEEICKKLCPDHCWGTNYKAFIGALTSMTN